MGRGTGYDDDDDELRSEVGEGEEAVARRRSDHSAGTRKGGCYHCSPEDQVAGREGEFMEVFRLVELSCRNNANLSNVQDTVTEIKC